MPPYKKHVVAKRPFKKVTYVRKLPISNRLRPSGLNNGEHTFNHTVVISVPYNTGNAGITGFALPSTTAATDNPGLRWTFSPISANVYNANSGTNGGTVGNYAYYTGIFERFRLDKVNIKAFWTNNVANVGVSDAQRLTYQPVLPILQVAYDPEFSAATPVAVTTLLDYPTMSTCQMGTSAVSMKSGASFDRDFYPSIAATATAASQAYMPKKTFLSVDQGNFPVYCGVLMYNDLQTLEISANQVQTVGIMTFYVKIFSTFKGIR